MALRKTFFPAADTEIAAFIAANGTTRLPEGKAQGIDTAHIKTYKHANKPGRGRKGRSRARE